MPKRDVLLIPLDQVLEHLATNQRQDLKVIAPSILTPALWQQLTAAGKTIKQEEPLTGDRWECSGPTEPNKLCESADFAFGSADPSSAKGPLAVSFANEKALQEEHFHIRHAEAYFSEHGISGYYRRRGEPQNTSISLPRGGTRALRPRHRPLHEAGWGHNCDGVPRHRAGPHPRPERIFYQIRSNPAGLPTRKPSVSRRAPIS